MFSSSHYLDELCFISGPDTMVTLIPVLPLLLYTSIRVFIIPLEHRCAFFLNWEGLCPSSLCPQHSSWPIEGIHWMEWWRSPQRLAYLFPYLTEICTYLFPESKWDSVAQLHHWALVGINERCMVFLKAWFCALFLLFPTLRKSHLLPGLQKQSLYWWFLNLHLHLKFLL